MSHHYSGLRVTRGRGSVVIWLNNSHIETADQVQRLAEELPLCVAREKGDVVVDFSRVEAIAPEAIRVFLTLYRGLKQGRKGKSRSFTLCSMAPAVLGVFQADTAYRMFTIQENALEALGLY